jgi:hypothetical protein
LKERLINLIALRALVEMVAYVWKKLVYIFSLKLKIDIVRKDVKKLGAKHLLVLDGKDASY